MNPGYRLVLVTLALAIQVNTSSLFSQTTDYIDGRVINSTTHESVQFATIRLKYNQLGIYANAAGDFKISANPEFRTDSVIITCIGYIRYSVAFKDLKNQTLNQIYLTPFIYGLAEVKISSSAKKLGSPTIITRAIRNIQKNYPQKPFSYVSYYRDYQKHDSNYVNLNEGIIQVLDNGFEKESIDNRYRLLDFRKNTDFPRMNISPYYETDQSDDPDETNKIIPDAKLGDQYGNELFVLMVHDALRNFNTRSFSFVETFSDDFIFNHNFSEPTAVYDNNLLLYKIIFNGRSRVIPNSLLVSGAIYIQPRTYAIYKLEYSCSYQSKKKGLGEMFNIDIEYGHGNATDSAMYLKYISFNNYFKVIDKDDSTYFRVLDSYMDAHSNIKSTVVLYFNNMVDPVKASKKDNYTVTCETKNIRISHIQVVGTNVFLRLNDEDINGNRDSIKVLIKNISDVNGNILYKKKSIEVYQYRELFVQEYNKPLSLKDSCYMEYKPLEINCISKFSGNEKYWMNTPENIKRRK